MTNDYDTTPIPNRLCHVCGHKLGIIMPGCSNPDHNTIPAPVGCDDDILGLISPP